MTGKDKVARIRSEVRHALQALSADGEPVPARVIAARTGYALTVTTNALADLERNANTPTGPLNVRGGWVWVA